MANPEHVRMIKLARENHFFVQKWLADFSGELIDLSGANLDEVVIWNLSLGKVNLESTSMRGSRIIGSDFKDSNLRKSDFSSASIHGSKILSSDFESAEFELANLIHTDFSHCSFRKSNFRSTLFQSCSLKSTELALAVFDRVAMGDINLSLAQGLDATSHLGPSTLGLDTIATSKGIIPNNFLRGCGISGWMQCFNTLCDPSMTANEISELITTELFDLRTEGPIHMGGVFLSYSHVDSGFVDRLYQRIKDDGISVWQDKHNLNAGSIEKQVIQSLRIQDIVVVVLSKASLCSDWVWHEIETAREKEQKEGRDVLCPITIDDAWHSPEKYDDRKLQFMFDEHPLQFRFLKKKNILKFNADRIDQKTYDKLIRGMKINYEVPKEE